MNCTECRELSADYLEETLDIDAVSAYRQHLEICDGCRSFLESSNSLRRRLMNRGAMTADVSMVESVMDKISRLKIEERIQESKRITFMSRLLNWRWSLGMSAFASVAVLILIAFLTTPDIQVAAAEIMTRGANAVAKLSGIHLRGQLRASPTENFSEIAPDHEFVSIELWKEFEPVAKWRVDKPGRLAVMDGQSTMLFVKPDRALKLSGPSKNAFDTQWLQEIADVNRALKDELQTIRKNGWTTTVTNEKGIDGKMKSMVTVEAKSGFPNDDYLKNTFFCTADTRRVYVFDDQTGLLISAKIYLHTPSGPKLIFELTQIECNPTFAADVFQLQLPEGVSWAREMQILPDNGKYAAMDSEQAARAFFDACGREDWNETGKFCTVTGTLKNYLGGVKIISLGKHFTSMISLISGAQFIPYEIQLKDGSVKKHNIALKRDSRTKRWFIDGGI